MSIQILYSKKYPQVTPSETLKQHTSTNRSTDSSKMLSWEEFYKLCMGNVKGRRRTHGDAEVKEFIRTAIDVSEMLELDTEIVRHSDYVAVDFSFDCCGTMADIKHVLNLADEISFFAAIKGRDITIALLYYTDPID